MTRKSWPLSTKDIEKAKKQKAKEEGERTERARRHKITVAKLGDRALIPFPKRKGG